MKNYTVPELLKKVLIGFHDGFYNLKCPMCFVHSNENREEIDALKGTMPYEKVCKVLDELAAGDLYVTPNLWNEPTVFKNFKEYILAIKNCL